VHAKGQIAHFDTDQTQIPPEGMRRAVNYRLPDDILIRHIEPVPDTFDAIASTISKRYQFFIWNTLDHSPFFSELAWHRWQPLDVTAMRAAAAYLVGTHDFTTLRPGPDIIAKQRCGRFFRLLGVVPAAAHRDRIEGTGFLWNMVRIMVGNAGGCGIGRYVPEDIPRWLPPWTAAPEAQPRRRHGTVLAVG